MVCRTPSAPELFTPLAPRGGKNAAQDVHLFFFQPGTGKQAPQTRHQTSRLLRIQKPALYHAALKVSIERFDRIVCSRLTRAGSLWLPNLCCLRDLVGGNLNGCRKIE